MSDYREFQGKTLDTAIKAACEYYDVPREKLNIEIVSDAKGGIFGLVGARKATIRARLVRIESIMDSLDEPESKESKGKPARKDAKPRREERGTARSGDDEPEAGEAAELAEPAEPAEPVEPAPHPSRKANARGRGKSRNETQRGASRNETPKGESPDTIQAPGQAQAQPPAAAEAANPATGSATGSATGAASNQAPSRAGRDKKDGAAKSPSSRRGAKSLPRAAKKAPEPRPAFPEDDENNDELPRAPLSSLDENLVLERAREVIRRLVEPMLGENSPTVVIEGETLRIGIQAGEDPGLLIGREGQNLAAIQYLGTRMLANTLQCRVKLHLDAGDYKQRQDDKLRELALTLADKTRESGKPQLTRPLSSYQRRVIHMALQDDEEVQTHSKGEGDLKRVVIAPRKNNR